MKDYYSIMGVSEKATSSEIKSAYRKLALKYHPDTCPENKKKESSSNPKSVDKSRGRKLSKKRKNGTGRRSKQIAHENRQNSQQNRNKGVQTR